MASSKSNQSVNYKSGVAALKSGKLFDAEAAFAQAIAEDEKNSQAWLKLGLTWTKMERHTEAAEAYQMAATLAPDDAEALHNLGLALIQSGKNEQGLQQFEAAYRISEDDTLAMALGDSYYNQRDYKRSSYYYLKAYQNKKSDAALTHRLAIALYQDNDPSRAVALMTELVLRHPKNPLYVTTLVEIYNKLPHEAFSNDAKRVVELGLRQENVRYRNLAAAWHSLFLLDPALEKLRGFPALPAADASLKDLAPAFASPFLCLGLQKIIVAKAPIEHILTQLRKYCLLHWQASETWPQETLGFLTSLAVQCWFNDFVYYITHEEKEHLAGLLSDLTPRLPGQTIGEKDAVLFALAACYGPVYEFYRDEAPPSFGQKTASTTALLIETQLTNPRTEAALIPTIPSFTEIEDVTSKAVQAMYESRPYPRWTSANAQKASEGLRNVSRNIDILVAGCGTGQEPVMYAGLLPETRITAIDLSRASIAYGMRMAAKMDLLPRINFMQGDLMKVGELNKKFDYVASSGVLHHLKEPEKGLSAILETLRPGGKLSISLYSKHARDFLLNPAIDYIKEKGYTASLDDVREFRHDLFKMSPNDPRTLCTHATDFFSLAECNDLLFHVQEHRYTFPMIKDMAERHGLVPFSVFLYPNKIKQFEEMFPGGARSDLDLMDKFELAHPDTFAEMYKVYFYRKGENPSHPLDPLILLGAI